MERFKDKIVIVTGGASGIGKATARRFAEEGAKVTVFGHSDDTAERIADLPGKVTAKQVDVRDSAAVKQAVDEVAAEHGRLDVLHNNAGVAVMKAPEDHTDEDWDKVIQTNLTGVFNCSRAAIPHLEKSRGCIVNTSSVSGLAGDWGMLAYNASKGGVSNLTRSLALDLGRKGVRVNAVAPSLTDTAMGAGIIEDSEKLASFRERMPLDPPAEPADIAAVVTFLASDDARMVNGVVLPVDGGVMASNGQPPIG